MAKTGSFLNQTQLAKALGVTRQRIIRLEQEGRLSRRKDGKYDKRIAEAVFADMEPHKRAEGQLRKTPGATMETTADPTSSSSATLVKVKTKEAFYKAQRQELAYKREAGEMVNQKEVEDAVFAIGRKLQTKMRAWEPRFLAHMTDTGKSMVRREIGNLLEEINEDLENVTNAADN